MAADLDRRAWADTPQSRYIPDGEHVWRIWCEHAVTYVAATHDALLGVALAFACTDGRYCMHKVFVDPRARGRGLGTQLMERAIEEVERLGAPIFLTVDPDNHQALGLYEKMGFLERCFVKGYYRDNEDRYVLTRRTGKEHSR